MKMFNGGSDPAQASALWMKSATMIDGFRPTNILPAMFWAGIDGKQAKVEHAFL
ncbi:MAG TPA: hypothetical protein VGI03_10195 [Verrucomicrobiae bacterium]|jgi:hypothetical protein